MVFTYDILASRPLGNLFLLRPALVATLLILVCPKLNL